MQVPRPAVGDSQSIQLVKVDRNDGDCRLCRRCFWCCCGYACGRATRTLWVRPGHYRPRMPSAVIVRITASSLSKREWWRDTLPKSPRPPGSTFFAHRTIGME